MSPQPERITLPGTTLTVPRIITGLWQLADIQNNEPFDIPSAADAMQPLISAGLDAFDMSDHYGDAELVIGQHHKTNTTTTNNNNNQNITAFTKWCPVDTATNKSFENAKAAIQKSLTRMGTEKLDLLQYHMWSYTDDAYLHNLSHLRTLQEQGMIRYLGLTNTDTAHLELLLDSGIPIVSNQVSCSVIDRRLMRGRMGKVCMERGVGVLAYGTLLGGYLSEKWLGEREPENNEGSLNWSLRKYLRFIQAAGGWDVFQGVLRALATVAERHGVTIATVATRWVLDQPPISAVIVGSRLTADSSKYIARNLQAFEVKLTDEDHKLIADAQEKLTDIPGDCGDEYRKAPLLTVTGDLSHHLEEKTKNELAKPLADGMRIEYSSGSKWEPIAGYCRAVRTGDVIRVSGTTASSPVPGIAVLGGESAASQTHAILEIIERAIKALGGTMSDVVRTRIMLKNVADIEAVSAAHGYVFGGAGVRPSNTLVMAGLVGDEYLVEIEAEAQLGSIGVVRVN